MSRLKNREYRDYIEDILSEVQLIRTFVAGYSFEEFLDEPKTQYAVCKALENMGEASKRIPESIRKKYPDVPFRQMAGLRDVVTHDYDGISYDMIWEVVERRLPALEIKLLDMLETFEKNR